MKKILLLSIILTLFSCGPSNDPLRNFFGSYRNYTNVNGKIKDGRYYDPYGRFSVQVPNLLKPGMITDGYFSDAGGTITFSDDIGSLIRIDVLTMLDSSINSTSIDNNWQTFLPRNRDMILNLYRAAVPQSAVIHQEYIVWKEKHADYFVVDMKGVSTLSKGSDKKDDTLRLSLSFIHNKSFYTISTQYIDLWRRKTSRDDIIKNMLKKLRDTADTIDFIKQ